MSRSTTTAAVTTTVGAFAAVTSVLGFSGAIRVGLAKEAAAGTAVRVYAVDDTTTPGATTATPPGRFLGTLLGPADGNSGLDVPEPAPAALAFYRTGPSSSAPAVNADITGDVGARTPTTTAAPTTVGSFTAAASLATFTGPVVVALAKEAIVTDGVQVWAVDDPTSIAGTGSPLGRYLGTITGPQGPTSRLVIASPLPAALVFKRTAGTAARNVKVYGGAGASGVPASVLPTPDTIALRTSAGAIAATDFNGGARNNTSITGQTVNVVAVDNINHTAENGEVNFNAGTTFTVDALETIALRSSTGAVNVEAASINFGAGDDVVVTAPVITLTGNGLFTTELGSWGLTLPNGTTAQRNAIASPQEASVVYDLNEHRLYVRTDTQWQSATSLFVQTFFQKATVDTTMAVTGAETAWPSSSGLNAVTVAALSGDVVTTRAKMRTTTVAGSPSVVWRIKHTKPDTSIDYSGYDAGGGGAVDWTFTGLTAGNHVFELQYTNSVGGSSFRCFPATAQESCSFTVEHKHA